MERNHIVVHDRHLIYAGPHFPRGREEQARPDGLWVSSSSYETHSALCPITLGCISFIPFL